MKIPVLFSNDVERPEPDEAQTTRELVETLTQISAKVFEDEKHAYRAVHAKSHAVLRGTLTVDTHRPELAQGIFERAATYNTILRFSSTPGDWLKDSVSTPRGLAIKVFGVPGSRLPDATGATQDFIFVNGPAFAAPDAKHFLRSLKLLAGTTDKAPGLKSALSRALRGTERALESVGIESGTIKALGGHPATHPLGETFFTQVPIRFGDHIAKLRVRPITAELAALHNQSVDITHAPNALRDLMRAFFASHSGEWLVEAQLCRDLESMPVEKADVVWSEEDSPYLPVARLRVPAQDSWAENAAGLIEDRLAFSAWHGVEAHRPLGSVMRVRKACYEASAQFRAAHNQVTISEEPPAHPGP